MTFSTEVTVAKGADLASAATIAAVRSATEETFVRLDVWCAMPWERLHHRPAYPQAWTAA